MQLFQGKVCLGILTLRNQNFYKWIQKINAFIPSKSRQNESTVGSANGSFTLKKSLDDGFNKGYELSKKITVKSHKEKSVSGKEDWVGPFKNMEVSGETQKPKKKYHKYLKKWYLKVFEEVISILTTAKERRLAQLGKYWHDSLNR